MTTITQLKPTTLRTTRFTATRHATDANAAQTYGLMQNNPHPAAMAFAKASSEAVTFGRGNLEAVAQSAQTYLTGMQDLGQQYIAAIQGLTRHALEGAQGFAGVKSLKDAMALQASLARASMERALGQGMKLQQAALTLTEQVHAPLLQRATAAIEHTRPSRAA